MLDVVRFVSVRLPSAMTTGTIAASTDPSVIFVGLATVTLVDILVVAFP